MATRKKKARKETLSHPSKTKAKIIAENRRKRTIDYALTLLSEEHIIRKIQKTVPKLDTQMKRLKFVNKFNKQLAEDLKDKDGSVILTVHGLYALYDKTKTYKSASKSKSP